MDAYEKRGFVSKIDGERLLLRLSKQFYEKSAVMNAVYKFTHKCFILVEPLEEGFVGVWFKAKDGQEPGTMSDLLHDFCNEVLDQQVRLDLEKRYGNLRDAILNHAFQPLGDVTKCK